jgi:hypothetical protein
MGTNWRMPAEHIAIRGDCVTGRGLADLGQQASGGAELPPGHRSDHQVHPVADIEPRESDRGRLPLRQAKAPCGGTGR